MWKVTTLLVLSLVGSVYADDNGQSSQDGAQAQASTSMVMIPPHVMVPDSNMYVHRVEGSLVKFHCEAEGVPKPTIKWTKDLKDIKTIGSANLKCDPKNNDLKIKNFGKKLEGTYQCVATNKFGTSLSPGITVTIGYLPSFNNHDAQFEKKAPLYAYLKMECTYKEAYEANDVYYQWYREKSTAQVREDEGRIYVDLSGNIHFSSVLKKDKRSHPNGYRCGLVSTSLGSIVMGPQYQLTTKKAQMPPPKPPKFAHSNNNVKVVELTDGYLECFFSGIKILKTLWFNYNKEPVPGNRTDKFKLENFGHVLHIKNVTQTDAGNYYCQAENAVGKSKLMPVNLIVIAGKLPPRWLRGAPEYQVRSEGEDAEIICETTKADKIQWYINGKPVSRDKLDKTKYELSEDGTKLTIFDLKKATDNQCVQCQVTNKYGQIWGDSCVRVLLPITILKKPKSPQEIVKGDVIDLTVVAESDEGAGQLDYMFRIKDKLYGPGSTPPHVDFNSENLEASIDTSELDSDDYSECEGTYERIVNHSYAQKIVKIEVELADGSAWFARLGIGWIIGIILGILLCILLAGLAYYRMRRKKNNMPEYTPDEDINRDVEYSVFDSSADPSATETTDGESTIGTTVDYTDSTILSSEISGVSKLSEMSSQQSAADIRRYR